MLASQLAARGIDGAELEARILVGYVTGLDLTQLVAGGARALTAEEAATVAALARRRLSDEPVARIVGEQEFWGLRLALSPATLIPRSDTETVVEAALDCLRAMPNEGGRFRIADLGTGSGAILLALLSEMPHARGLGTDINREALRTAHRNAERLGLSDRAEFIEANYAAGLRDTFDLIVSNPPYIRSDDIAGLAPDVREHDPRTALDGGSDGLDAYRAIAMQAPALLRPHGALVVEIGIGQAADVAGILAAAGLFPDAAARPDLAGVARAVTARKPRRNKGMDR